MDPRIGRFALEMKSYDFTDGYKEETQAIQVKEVEEDN